MGKIAIWGNSGTGKSITAKQLGEKLGYQVVHLDDYLFINGHYRTTSDFIQTVSENLNKDNWIVEGLSYVKFDKQFTSVNKIIFLGLSNEICIENIRKRGKREGQTDEEFEAFLQRVANFSFDYAREKLAPATIPIYWLSTTEEITDFIENYPNVEKYLRK